MPLGRLLTFTLTLVLSLLLAPGPAAQGVAEVAPTTLTLQGERAHAGAQTPVRVTLQSDGAPVAGAEVLLERRVDEAWQQVAVLVTDAEGRAASTAQLARQAADNVFRATYAGDPTHAPAATGPVTVPLARRASVVRLAGPKRVVDGRVAVLEITWRARNGDPVPGRVRLLRSNAGKRGWRPAGRPATGADGTVRVRVRPRVDTRWRVRAPRLDWVEADTSPVHRVDNVPPGNPVRLPRRAPRPRVNLPDQRRAVGAGANPVVTPIPQQVWNQMTGRSWHRGCPVGRGQLRLLRINYWGYDGYRYRGELVAHADAVGNMRGALAQMHARRLPIRSMYRVDRFGWSRRLHGADDYRSMAAGNTSAFNCRDVVGRPGVRSPHSYGRSLDVNPWENPYRASHGWTPNSWWVGRSHPRVAWRSRSHAVVRLMARHGLRWTYGTGDAHHFDARAGSGRVITARAPGCATQICH